MKFPFPLGQGLFYAVLGKGKWKQHISNKIFITVLFWGNRVYSSKFTLSILKSLYLSMKKNVIIHSEYLSIHQMAALL